MIHKQTQKEKDQINHNDALNLNTIINPHGIPAEVYEVSSPIHQCTIQLKHAHGYQCPECYKITK
jgi:hypothetical protein